MAEKLPVSRNGKAGAPELPKRAKRSFDNKAQRAFLELTTQGMSAAAAMRQLGFSRQRAYELAKQDEQFALAWREAREEGADLLEDIAFKLATEGGEDVEYDGSGNVRRRTKRAPSAAIVARVLAAWRPERWGDKPTQVGVGIGVQITGHVKHDLGLTLDDLVRDIRVLRPGDGLSLADLPALPARLPLPAAGQDDEELT